MSRRGGARRRARFAGLGTLIGGLVLGGSAAFGVGALRAEIAPEAVVFTPDPRSVQITPAELGPGEATPRAAIESFLAAEIGDEPAAAVALLSAADRLTVPTASVWERARTARIGDLRSYGELVVTPDGDGSATATTVLTLAPSLDSINGLTAPQVAATWRLVEDDGWRVDVRGSRFAPDFTAESGSGTSVVHDAAGRWLSESGACDPDGAAGPDAVFRGSHPALVAELCRLDVVPRLEEPHSLAPLDAVDLVATFGSEVRTWAVVVPVAELLSARLVLAPVGARWVVIDVLPVR